MYLQVLEERAYSNCKMMSPDGVFMCRIGIKRADWYLGRGLAKVVSYNPYTIKLIFRPNGLGNHRDAYYLEEKENICVVCGSENELTKHHTIPRCFRRHFPLKLKKHSSHDVLLVCRSCHEEYEKHATILKDKLIKNLSFNICEESVRLARAIKAAKTLIRYEDKLPYESAINLMINIEDCVGKFDDSVVANLAEQKHTLKHSKDAWLNVVNEINDFGEFSKMWRQHFVDVMEPKYLPKHWSVLRK